MNTTYNNNRTQKNWNTFALIVTIITAIIVIGGAFQIFTNL
jgi:heme/copper-type cytochrome/quinol oxidase subunit 4